MNNALFDVVVASKTKEATGIYSFELVDPQGGELPQFSAGSHIDVEVAPGILRQYSLCNSSEERKRYKIAVLQEPESRGGSAAMANNVEAGQRLRISMPRNLFELDEQAERSLLIAGGIGVTPILSMATRLTQLGTPFSFHYCTRSRERAAFLDHIIASDFAGNTEFHFDDEPDTRLDLDVVLSNPATRTHLYICGPTGFMDLVLSTAVEKGWPESSLHQEYFSASLPDESEQGTFRVRIASSGEEHVIPSNRTIISVLADAGIEIPISCAQGVCGTCLTNVLEGEPEHFDMFLTKDEHASNKIFTPCCSRSKSPVLVLDL